MAINYFESSNRYTDPVRYFKANDPYYFEVDNIPVKQLEENSKFLKDQIDGLLTRQGREILDAGQTTTLDRVNFNELKPFVNNSDSIVKIMPGRYTTRVNDAYTQSPLQFITQVFDNAASEDTAVYKYETAKSLNVKAALDKFKTKVSDNATLMNGLFERVFVYGMKNIVEGSEGVDSTNPNNVREPSDFDLNTNFWPGLIGNLHRFDGATDAPDDTFTLARSNFRGVITDENFRTLGRHENEFIKRWRGVTRTSIVDVPEVLEIAIPEFNPQEFFFTDADGNDQTVESNQRIDLLFVYSKSVDQSETTVASYTNGSPRTITKPTLGIVKGAGLGVKEFENSVGPKKTRVDLQSLDGVTLMVPNSSDQLAENTGFSTSAGVIRGSFPSPDDLMNLAPLLAESLSTDAVSLIGQTILPIAYIVVRNNTEFNPLGEAIITSDDIIDIRPFFRTTELAYNERAGIAAATPQISIANPVVSEAGLEFAKKEVTDKLETLVQNRVDPVIATLNSLRVQKTFLLPIPLPVTGLRNKRMNTFTFNTFEEIEITDLVGGPVGTNENPYSLKGVYFDAVFNQGNNFATERRRDSDEFDFQISDIDTTTSFNGDERFRSILIAGISVDNGEGGGIFSSQALAPVKVTSDGRVFILFKVSRNGNNHNNEDNKHEFTLKVSGFIYEPELGNITFEIPGGAM